MNIYDWIYEKWVITLHKITHMHFDFTTAEGFKITASDGKERNIVHTLKSIVRNFVELVKQRDSNRMQLCTMGASHSTKISVNSVKSRMGQKFSGNSFRKFRSTSRGCRFFMEITEISCSIWHFYPV